MNVYYTKTALYAYPNIMAIADQIDELVERRAILSMNDYSPAIEQCEKVIDLTSQKDALFALRLYLDKALSGLSDYDMDCLEYKYFKRKGKEYFVGFDFESRNYFRKQVRLVKKISNKLEKAGANDKWFEEFCMSMDFFKELFKRVIEHEKNSLKNKKKPKKNLTKSEQEKRQTA